MGFGLTKYFIRVQRSYTIYYKIYSDKILFTYIKIVIYSQINLNGQHSKYQILY